MRAGGTSNRLILALAVPATAALAADPLLSLLDTALVGRLGPTPLAALGIDAAVFTTGFWVLVFLTWATTAARLRGGGARGRGRGRRVAGPVAPPMPPGGSAAR